MPEIITSGLAIIATLAGTVRWLIQVYFKQSKELAQTKGDLYLVKMESLKQALEENKECMNQFQLEIHKISKDQNTMKQEHNSIIKSFIEINNDIASLKKAMSIRLL